MADGRAPAGQAGFKISALRPEYEVPFGRQESWLGHRDSK